MSLSAAAEHGAVRHDVPVDELVLFVEHALAAGGELGSPQAVERLVRITVSGLRNG